jgi:hypothetical protein
MQQFNEEYKHLICIFSSFHHFSINQSFLFELPLPEFFSFNKININIFAYFELVVGSVWVAMNPKGCEIWNEQANGPVKTGCYFLNIFFGFLNFIFIEKNSNIYLKFFK